MTEHRVNEPTEETISPPGALTVRDIKGFYGVGHGLKDGDQPTETTLAAQKTICEQHPEAPSDPGFGYAGGGFGSYRICIVCGTIFGKRA